MRSCDRWLRAVAAAAAGRDIERAGECFGVPEQVARRAPRLESALGITVRDPAHLAELDQEGCRHGRMLAIGGGDLANLPADGCGQSVYVLHGAYLLLDRARRLVGLLPHAGHRGGHLSRGGALLAHRPPDRRRHPRQAVGRLQDLLGGGRRLAQRARGRRRAAAHRLDGLADLGRPLGLLGGRLAYLRRELRGALRRLDDVARGAALLGRGLRYFLRDLAHVRRGLHDRPGRARLLRRRDRELPRFLLDGRDRCDDAAARGALLVGRARDLAHDRRGVAEASENALETAGPRLRQRVALVGDA